MEALPLPPRPSLDQYRKRAKGLLDAMNASDPAALGAWMSAWQNALSRALADSTMPKLQTRLREGFQQIERRLRELVAAAQASGTPLVLADAQHLIAWAHAFSTWSEFADHVRRLAPDKDTDDAFEAAVDAVVTGNLATLEALLRRQPELLHAHSARKHRATLLHYVAANGVEDYRQLTPPNAVEVARLLLSLGARVDDTANTYGGGWAQTTMNLLVSSAHPAGAGLQPPLVEVLLDFGAAINGLADDGSPLMTALRFGYLDAAQTLERRGARIDNVIAAAALGRVDVLQRLIIDRETLAPEARFVTTEWLSVPPGAKAHIDAAVAWACKFGQTAAAEYLLDIGVGPAGRDCDDATPLHWACTNGLTVLIPRLLALGAPLEVMNRFGGTVLDSTIYDAVIQPVPGVDYVPILETLIAAGADLRAIDWVAEYPVKDSRVADLLRRHGVRVPQQ